MSGEEGQVLRAEERAGVIVMKVLINFVCCVVFNEVFALLAAYSQLSSSASGGGYGGSDSSDGSEEVTVPIICIIAAMAVVIQGLVFIHASGEVSSGSSSGI